MQPLDRAAMVARLGAETFDLAVIGGGINGAAIARDAALRGLRVALVDKGDFAGATSSRSSKLIHGGLRYLPQGHIRMVYQALRERERLRHLTAPHLVHPIRFLMPFYRGQRPGRLALVAGLTLYDWMAWTPRAERRDLMTAAHLRAIEPGLRAEGMGGGASYTDAWGDDARLTLENLLDAAYHGAAVVNYAAVEGFGRSGSTLSGIALRDQERDTSIELRARLIVNAAGPWVDELRLMDDPGTTPSVRLTKGVHLVIDSERLPVRNALVLTDHGGRIVFVMPRGRYVLIGTTDTDFAGDRDRPAVATEDIEYLLAVVADALPDFALNANDVIASFAGLRALPHPGGGRRPSSVPREEVILESAAGLITVAGGKLTTHRAIAEQVIDRVAARLGIHTRSCVTPITPLPGARPCAEGQAKLESLPTLVCDLLRNRYGTRAGIVAQIVGENAALARPLSSDASAIGAEVIFVVRYELAQSVADFLVRRTAMTWRAPHAAIAAAPAVARLMATELGWSPAREADELDRFKHQSESTIRPRPEITESL
jgi:glycerol-3-phosphate dehydrogenase